MITPILAVEIDNNQLGMGMITIFALLFGLYLKLRGWETSIRTGGKVELKQPVDVAIKKDPLTRGEHEALCVPLHQRVTVLESDVREIRSQMKADKREIISAGDDRVAVLREELNDLRKDVNSAPARTVALLRDTKGLIP